MSLMSKRAMRRERRRTEARLRTSEYEVAFLTAKLTEARGELAQRTKHFDTTMQWWRDKYETERRERANRLHGNIYVAGWPAMVSP